MKIPKSWLALIGVSLANFLGCLDFTIVNTALPAMQKSLAVSTNVLQWTINIFLLGLCACMVIMGRLADIKGRRLLLYIGMLGFGLTSLGAGLSFNYHILLMFRLLQGVFTAILYTAPVAIVSQAFSLGERGKAVGLLFSINGLGLALGPVFGGVIVSALSWHWVFLVNVPVIFLSFIICLICVEESYSHEHGTKIDMQGFILLAISLVSIVLAVVQCQQWSALAIIALFIIACIGFAAFYIVEQRIDSPIIKFSLFANKLFVCCVLVTASLGFYYCLAFFLMPLYLHYSLGLSGYSLGLMLLPATLVMTILSVYVGHATDKYGPKSIIIAGIIFLILSAILQYRLTTYSTLMYVAFTYAAMGVGWSALLGPSTVAALTSVPTALAGVATGSAWTLHNIGGVLGLAIGMLIYHVFSMSSIVPFSLSGFKATMLLLVGVMLLALMVIFVLMPNKNKH